MPKLICVAVVILGTNVLLSQQNNTQNKEEVSYHNVELFSPYYVIAEEMPIFNHENINFEEYISFHISTPPEECPKEAVFVQFTVEENGIIGYVKVIRGLENCIEYKSKVEHAIKNMPAWTPAKIRDKKIRLMLTKRLMLF